MNIKNNISERRSLKNRSRKLNFDHLEDISPWNIVRAKRIKLSTYTYGRMQIFSLKKFIRVMHTYNDNGLPTIKGIHFKSLCNDVFIERLSILSKSKDWYIL